MKTLLCGTCAVMLTTFAMPAAAQQYQFEAADDSVTTKLCIEAVKDNKYAVKRLMRNVGTTGHNLHKAKFAANHVRCNDLPISQFAYKYGADSTANYLNKFSYGENKIGTTKVEIKDLAATNKTIVILVSSSAP
ncbi:DUF3718 domain-containing protein [Thalassotalea agarivorans]|uniref:DUF3718 domain-containing protein n=1 Tax=Thalassotalea agarivorans TaxID=349064 RepID=A0A1I0CDI8_THASX|nr:DUF3718 domain-containing protein [Thalassotalea agarivorans]SET17634.1 Protein of unknown function [Thalassotalea agarivorans]